jgi:hypothetical protein
VRLRNISLRTALRKLERTFRAREQLADGLHMIDFEQLKIENQTLLEKIEERNEELAKLKRKKTTTVQVFHHSMRSSNILPPVVLVVVLVLLLLLLDVVERKVNSAGRYDVMTSSLLIRRVEQKGVNCSMVILLTTPSPSLSLP